MNGNHASVAVLWETLHKVGLFSVVSLLSLEIYENFSLNDFSKQKFLDYR